MELNLTPVKVDISIENNSLAREAFYNLCFITENDEAPRTLEVNTLSDLLDNGYKRQDLAYNFCVGVFAQQSIPLIYIRAKRSYETYEEAFSSDSNDNYYYTVIESKDLDTISNFNDYLVSNDDYKLQFYSSNKESIEGKKLVHYFFDRGSDRGDFYLSKVMGEPDYLEPIPNNPNNPIDSGDSAPQLVNINTPDVASRIASALIDPNKLTPIQLQQQRLTYPEAAWIGACGNSFPSRVNWLNKFLLKVDVLSREKRTPDELEIVRAVNIQGRSIPDLSTTSALVFKNRATVGSGLTTQGIVIHEQVSLDWIKWALGRKVWKTLYTKERMNGSTKNTELIINDVKEVLNLALEEEMLSEYQITEVTFDRRSNNLSLKFSCKLLETILFVDISGSLYY